MSSGDPQHLKRIEKDMQLMDVTVASTIDTPEQYNTFVEKRVGLKPLLQTIRDGAREITRRGDLGSTTTCIETVVLGTAEEALVDACAACRMLKDLCVKSKPFAAIVTDAILQADASAWSEKLLDKNENSTSNGILSDFLTLLQNTRIQDFDRLCNRQGKKLKKLRKHGIPLVQFMHQSRGKSKLTPVPTVISIC